MDSYLPTLYQIEELLQTAIASRDTLPVEDALHLLNGIITELEMNCLNSDTDFDDETIIPIE